MNKKGFTLTELLAVIVVLAILITFVTVGVSRYIKSSEDSTNEVTLNHLRDAAITYALDSVFIPNECAINYLPNSTSISLPASCSKSLSSFQVSVKALKDQGLFKDSSNRVKENAIVLVYKYHDPANEANTYDIRAYVDKSALN